MREMTRETEVSSEEVAGLCVFKKVLCTMVLLPEDRRKDMCVDK